MNRRDFTKGLAALGLTPALPLPALAKAAPVALAQRKDLYFWANFVSRAHNKSSPEMLSRLLLIDFGHAKTLYGQLMTNGDIGPADAFGISKSTNPLYPQFSTVTGHGSSSAPTPDAQGQTRRIDAKAAQKDGDAASEQVGEDDDENEATLADADNIDTPDHAGEPCPDEPEALEEPDQDRTFTGH